MEKENELKLGLVEYAQDFFIPSMSVDCVIFGFHAKTLNVLLNKVDGYDKWILPGGFVKKNEDIDEAAFRVLNEKTGLLDMFLKQFYLFGKKDRNMDQEEIKQVLSACNLAPELWDWYLQRFFTLGYYALIKHEDAQIASRYSENITWFDIDDLPPLFVDHEEIISVALGTLRQQIGYVPIGYELLPPKFTMPELRSIYEAILGRELDRRNFQRKMLSVGLITPLNETRKCGAHKAPNLYSFNTEVYDKAKREGLQLMTSSL